MDPSRDLDRIVSELNARPEADGDEASDTAPLDRWLAALLAKGGSDLLLVPGAPVCILHEGGVTQYRSRAAERFGNRSDRAAGAHAACAATVSRRADCRFLLSHRGPGPLPHQSAPRTRPSRRGDSCAACESSAAERAAPSSRRRGAVSSAARAGADRRACRARENPRRWPL